MDAVLSEAVKAAIEVLRGYGLAGIVIGYLLWVGWQKDKRIEDLQGKAIEREREAAATQRDLLMLLRGQTP